MGLSVVSIHNTRSAGFDTRWTTPVEGLMTGFSYTASSATADLILSAYGLPLSTRVDPWRRRVVFADYQGAGLRLSGEWCQEDRDSAVTPAVVPNALDSITSRLAFVAGSYRLLERLEVGSYYSYYVYDSDSPAASPENHIYDKVVSARVDLNRLWHVKVEGHFMDGVGPITSLPRGFYYQDNPGGFERRTRMVVIRTGVNF